LTSVHTINLRECNYQNITDEGLKKLTNCRMMYLTSLDSKDKITDKFLKPFWDNGGQTRFEMSFDIFGF